MDPMTIALLIAAIWSIGLLVLVGFCRAAAHGDNALHTQIAGRRLSADSHEFRLGA